MNQDERKRLENWLTQTAQTLAYPPTPNIARAVRLKLDSPQRVALTWRLALAVVLALAAILFTVPEVRAGLVNFFRVGVVRIFLSTPTPTLAPTQFPAVSIPVTATPILKPTSAPQLADLLNLSGQTTLEDARDKASFPVLLPSYPSDLGQPQLVYYQPKAKMVILVWLEPDDPQKVRMSLHMLGPDSAIIKKVDPQVVEETSVNGQYALWTTGPYIAEVHAGDLDLMRLVAGHTLIWEQDSITYRLETGISLEEALKIAESLK